MFGVITGLYRAMEQGAALAQIAERHAGNPATMADAIRAALSWREVAVAPVMFTPAVEVEERVAA